jgi:hypothetical protein
MKGFLSRYVAFFMLAAMGVGMGVLGVYVGMAQEQNAVVGGGIIVACGSLLLLVPVYLGLVRRPRHVEVSEEGLAWKGRDGEQRCRWDEIREVYRLDRTVNQTFTEKKLVWVLADGRRVTTDQTLSDFDSLADAVQEQTTTHVLAAKRPALDGGGAEFGTVVLARSGLTIGGKRFSWDEIDHSTLFNGMLYFFPKSYQGNDSEDAKLSETPNSLVMLQLLDELGHAPVPVEQSVLYTGRKQGQRES